jgi:hypothetical protein
MSATTIHCHIDLEQFLVFPDKDLTGFLKNSDTGAPLTADEVRDVLRAEQAKGYTKSSFCDCRKPDGSCAGHPVDEEEGRDASSPVREGE